MNSYLTVEDIGSFIDSILESLEVVWQLHILTIPILDRSSVTQQSIQLLLISTLSSIFALTIQPVLKLLTQHLNNTLLLLITILTIHSHHILSTFIDQ